MNTLACLALVMYMEARGEPVLAKTYTAAVAVNLASQDNTSVCKSLSKKYRYSWMWDKRNTFVDKSKTLKLESVAQKVILNNPLPGYYFFNECRLGKRFKTPKEMVKAGNLCFY